MTAGTGRPVPLDLAAANAAAWAAAQPGVEVPAPAGRVRLVDGAWRVDGPRGPVALHARDPQREADCAVAAALDAQPGAGVLAVIGLGPGYVLDALERRGWTGRVLAVEIEPDMVATWLARRDWGPWLSTGRLRVLVAPEFTGASDGWRLFGDGVREPAVVVNPVLARLHPDRVEAARALVARVLFDAQANAEARRAFGGRYLLNTLGNLRRLAEEGDVASLAGIAASVPAVVVGAGPSLDRNLDDLRAVQHRALVIAVDTAARALLSAGVVPHVIVAVDPSEANARHLADLPPCPQTCLVAEGSLDAEALMAFRGRTFFFCVSDHEPWPWLRAQGCGVGRLRAWGSVLTSAFDLALLLGCNPVAFAGSDLAFTGDRPYARGVVYEEDWRRLADWGVPMDAQWRQQLAAWPRVDEPDVAGHPARTASHLVAFRNWLVDQMQRDPSRIYVNATGAGILHGAGIRRQSLAEALGTGAPRAGLSSLVSDRHGPREGARLVAAARTLRAHLARHPDRPALEDADGRPCESTLDAWQRFAHGVSRPDIAGALDRALDGPPAPVVPAPSDARAAGVFDAEWIVPLAAGLRLVPLSIPRVRMESVSPGVRRFRFRTTAARLIACVLQLPDEALAEDGRPLRLGGTLEHPGPGEYCRWRDEYYFTGSDGTDPRDNGRTYSLLVPECVAHLETLPFDTIVRHGV